MYTTMNNAARTKIRLPKNFSGTAVSDIRGMCALVNALFNSDVTLRILSLSPSLPLAPPRAPRAEQIDR